MNFENVIDIIKSEGQEHPVSADTVLNIVASSIEETGRLNGGSAANAKVEDERFAISRIYYLCDVLVAAIKNNYGMSARVDSEVIKEISSNEAALKQAKSDLVGVSDRIGRSKKAVEDLRKWKSKYDSDCLELKSLQGEIEEIKSFKEKLPISEDELKQQITELRSKVAAIHNAISSACQMSDLPEMLKQFYASSEMSVGTGSISFGDLPNWMNGMRSALEQGVEMYIEVYNAVLTAINSIK